MICLYLLRKTTAILQIPIVDTSPKFHLSITIIRHKKGGLICSDRLYADISSTTKLYFCISTNQIYKAINAERDLLSLSSTQLSPPKDRIESPIIIVWNCSMTSQKYRVVCLSASIIRNQLDKIWLSGSVLKILLYHFR